MLQTWTTFDGDRKPFIIVVHTTRGSMGVFTRESGGPHMVHWTDSTNPAYTFRLIDLLPKPAREIAWKYAGGRRE